MSGTHSRDKGAGGEREVAAIMGARKISRMYQPGPDLQMADGRWVEVKRRKTGFKTLYKWLDDDASIIAMRADRKDWLVAMTLDTLLDMLSERQL